jgi:hypothetical protein
VRIVPDNRSFPLAQTIPDGPKPSDRKAIVTFTIGEPMGAFWQKYSLPTWKKYATRHGYDLVVFNRPIDNSERAKARSISWQKLLLAGNPGLAAYDVIVWIDADIVINHRLAPCIASTMTSNRVGICEETEFPSAPLFSEMKKRYGQLVIADAAKRGILHPLDPHRRYGFAQPAKASFNGGLMVWRPAMHRQFLEEVYTQYEDKGPYTLYEQVPLSYRLAEAGLYETLDPKFNMQFSKLAAGLGMLLTPRPLADGRIGLIAALLNSCYFLDFAGVWALLMNDLSLIDFDQDPVSVRRS